MPLLSAGKTDIGQKRKTNQDAIYLNPEKNVFIVADGMGGHNGGDIASAMAVKHIPEYILQHLDQESPQLLTHAIRNAGQKIRLHGLESPKLQGMGTTAVMIMFKGHQLFIANVGDSRAYLHSRHGLFQLTRDHSMIQEKLNMGIYNRAQAAADPHKNVLVRTVGLEDNVEVDIFTYKVCKNDLFLLCSDGLHGKVSERDMTYILEHTIPSTGNVTVDHLKAATQRLIDQANQNGGQDNISVILVKALA